MVCNAIGGGRKKVGSGSRIMMSHIIRCLLMQYPGSDHIALVPVAYMSRGSIEWHYRILFQHTLLSPPSPHSLFYWNPIHLCFMHYYGFPQNQYSPCMMPSESKLVTFFSPSFALNEDGNCYSKSRLIQHKVEMFPTSLVFFLFFFFKLAYLHLTVRAWPRKWVPLVVHLTSL